MGKRKYSSDWTSHIFMAQSTTGVNPRPYKLELIEFQFSNADGPVLLMLSGYFQNAFVFDLLPAKEISLPRHLVKGYGFHVFALHSNGIGRSDYIKKSDLDDIAIDDIDGALKVLKKSYSKDIFVMGYSNGSITLQMYFCRPW